MALLEHEPGQPRGSTWNRRLLAFIAVPVVVVAAGSLAALNAPAPAPPPVALPAQPVAETGRLFVRTTAAGARLGVQVDEAEQGFVRADVWTSGAVGWAGAPLEAALASGLELRNAGVLGAAEGAPLSWVVVQTAPDAAIVRLVVDVVVDEMVPVDGWAVLVAEGALRTAHVEARAQDATMVGEATVAWPEPPPPSLTFAFRRSTADRVDVMLYTAPGHVVPELAYSGVVAMPGNGLLTFGADPDAACPVRVRGAYAFGRAEGWPAEAVVLRAGPEVALVKAVFEDGSTDEMVPVDGWAMLARAGVLDRWQIAAFGAEGQLVATVSGAPGDPCRG